MRSAVFLEKNGHERSGSLYTFRRFAIQASLHGPRIAASLGGSNWGARTVGAAGNV
jgi:hypothetical protein